MKRIRKGVQGEQIVAALLIKNGYKILARNVKILGVEVDLVIQRESSITLLEVKTHYYVGSGFEDIISNDQVQRLLKAKEYLKKKYYSLKVELYLAHLVTLNSKPKFYKLS